MSTFRAVMDIGTNSCRLLIAEIREREDISHVRDLRITRIGEGLGQGNLMISRAAMDRTLAALLDYRKQIDRFPAVMERIHLIGTQALREASNSLAFAEEIRKQTGFSLKIIDGQQEAFLSYTGAVSGLTDPELAKPMVLDIGGGSTELIWEDDPENDDFREGNGSVHAASVPIGSLRLLEKPMEREGILNTLKNGFQELSSSRAERGSARGEGKRNRALIAVAGTATTLGAIYLHMQEYDPEAMSMLRMNRGEVEEILDMLEGMSSSERLALPGMIEGREDVMPWGLKILLEVMTYCQQDEVVIRDRDLLQGALYTNE